jgi:hypothetical protein
MAKLEGTKIWEVSIKKCVDKKRPPENIWKILLALVREIRIDGPYRVNWQNYGKLGDNTYHCHLKKGNPTYVAVWEVIDRKVRIVEVIYAGTHEKAPY